MKKIAIAAICYFVLMGGYWLYWHARHEIVNHPKMLFVYDKWRGVSVGFAGEAKQKN